MLLKIERIEMKIMNKKNIINILKYTYLCIYLISYAAFFCGFTENIDNFLVILRSNIVYPGIVLLLISYDNETLNVKVENIFIMIILFIISTSIGHGVLDNEIIAIILLSLMFKNDDPKKLMKFILIFYLIYLSTTLLLSYSNIIKNNFYYRNEGIRHYFNFSHPNTLGASCLSLYCLITYCLPNKKMIIALFGVILFLFVYLYVDSRTSALLIILLLSMNIIYWVFRFISTKLNFKIIINEKIISILISSIPVICFVGTIIISIIYSENNTILQVLNKLLTGRLYLQNKAIIEYNIPIFGYQRIYNFSSNYDLVDNFFLYSIYEYGLALMSFIILFISYSIYKKRISINLFWIVFIWSLFGLSERFPLYFILNPFLLLLFNKNTNKENS